MENGQNHRQLEYNFLNLLLKVEGMNASATYKWLADGTKASVTDNSGYGFEYLGSFVYQKTPTNTSLESVAFGAGRFVANSIGSVIPNYYITDHLGSVRVVFTSPTNIVAQNDYYAFGLKHSNPNLANSSANRHLFNGKEWQSTGSVGLLDYGARMLDSRLGRWFGVDLLAEKYYSISPYVYCINNPLKYIDPTGMIIEDPDGIYGWHKSNIQDRLRYIREQLSTAEGDAKKNLQLLAQSYNFIIREYNKLEKSKQIYRISYTTGSEGDTYFDTDDIVMIRIGRSISNRNGLDGIIGHELKHAYQYEIGEISIRFDGKGFGGLYDISDETAAYNRERLINAGVSFFTDHLQWQNSDVRAFGKGMNPPAYQDLPEGPININSNIGKILRNNMINAPSTRIAPTDAYNGYINDYIKGLNKIK